MNGKFHYGKKEYLYTFLIIVFILFLVRLIWPSLLHPGAQTVEGPAKNWVQMDSIARQALVSDSILREVHSLPVDLSQKPTGKKHRILSVSSYDKEFPDMNDLQLVTAQRLGFPPVQNREAASHADFHRLVYAGNSPYYFVKILHNSIPYLVPKAQLLLNHIARTFIDSLMLKDIKPSMFIVTSFTRTQDDVDQLRKHNANASANSCHCYGTTFDISYTKYHAIQDPDAPIVRQTRDDTLRWVLSEVLRDQRKSGVCYVKFEKNQGCYHITVR